MLPNDEDKKISIENETRDAARVRLERRQASKKGVSFDDDIFDLSGRSAHRPKNAQDAGGDHAGSHNSHGCMAGRFVPIIVVFVMSRLRCRLSRRFRGLLSFASLRFLLSFR